MTKQTAQAILDWSHAITAETQNLLNDAGRCRSAADIGIAMRELTDAIQNEPVTPTT